MREIVVHRTEILDEHPNGCQLWGCPDCSWKAWIRWNMNPQEEALKVTVDEGEEHVIHPIYGVHPVASDIISQEMKRQLNQLDWGWGS